MCHQSSSIYSDYGANVYVVHLPSEWTPLVSRIDKELYQNIDRVQTLREARSLLPRPAWFHHKSRFGLTKRFIMTLVRPSSEKGENSNPGKGYSFSGQTTPGVPWNQVDGFDELVVLLDEYFGECFTICHANLYLEEKGKMAELSRHADDEKDLNRGKPIVCISLGTWPMRVLLFHKDRRVAEHVLLPGTSYVMADKTQQVLEHQIKQATKKQTKAFTQTHATPSFKYRLSLTFRVGS